MKYFTPELYMRLQDFSSDEVMNAADAAWEQARQRYHRLLKRIWPRLPSGMRFLQENFYLHDADVLSMGREGHTFVMVLRLDVPPKDLLILNYHLTEDAVINTSTLLGRDSSGPVQWMHDEAGLVRGSHSCCTHAILLSNGWEVVLRLSDVQGMRVQTVYPAPETILVPVAASVVPQPA